MCIIYKFTWICQYGTVTIVLNVIFISSWKINWFYILVQLNYIEKIQLSRIDNFKFTNFATAHKKTYFKRVLYFKLQWHMRKKILLRKRKENYYKFLTIYHYHHSIFQFNVLHLWDHKKDDAHVVETRTKLFYIRPSFLSSHHIPHSHPFIHT